MRNLKEKWSRQPDFGPMYGKTERKNWMNESKWEWKLNNWKRTSVIEFHWEEKEIKSLDRVWTVLESCQRPLTSSVSCQWLYVLCLNVWFVLITSWSISYQFASFLFSELREEIIFRTAPWLTRYSLIPSLDREITHLWYFIDIFINSSSIPLIPFLVRTSEKPFHIHSVTYEVSAKFDLISFMRSWITLLSCFIHSSFISYPILFVLLPSRTSAEPPRINILFRELLFAISSLCYFDILTTLLSSDSLWLSTPLSHTIVLSSRYCTLFTISSPCI